MTRADAPDGYVCVGEVTATATLVALVDTGGLLGRDVDVVAKQAFLVSSLFRPRTKTVQRDLRAPGRTMANLLSRRMDGEPAEGLQNIHPPIGDFASGL